MIEDLLKGNPKMVAFPCGHCRKGDLHTVFHRSRYGRPLPVGPQQAVKLGMIEHQNILCKCEKCKRDTYILAIPEQEVRTLRLATGKGSDATLGRDWVKHEGEVLHVWPVWMPSHESLREVEGLVKAAYQAHVCLSARAYDAVGTMGRRAMDCMCIDKKAQGRDVYHKLKNLHDRQVITQELYDLASEIRTLDKCGAHPEWEDVTKDEAENLVKFMDQVLNYVYIVRHDFEKARPASSKPKKPK